MKRIYTYLASAMLLAAGAIFFLTGCQKEKPEFLDLDLENITQMTEAQQQIFMKAVDRLDRHVTFEGDHYVLGSVSAEQLGLSERLFNSLRRSIAASNASLQQLPAQNLVAVEVSRNKLQIVSPDEEFGILSRSGELDDSGRPEKLGGTTKLEKTWYGEQLYLSNSDLRNIRDAAQLTSYLSGLGAFTPAAPFCLITAFVTDIVAWISDKAAERNPNGVVITVIEFGRPVYSSQP